MATPRAAKPKPEKTPVVHRVECEPITFADGRTYRALCARVEEEYEPGVASCCTIEAQRADSEGDFYVFQLKVYRSAMERGRFYRGEDGYKQMIDHLRDEATNYLVDKRKCRSLSFWNDPIVFEVE